MCVKVVSVSASVVQAAVSPASGLVRYSTWYFAAPLTASQLSATLVTPGVAVRVSATSSTVMATVRLALPPLPSLTAIVTS